MIDWGQLDWNSILQDGFSLLVNRNEDAFFRLVSNFATQVISQLGNIAAVPIDIEIIDENFIQQLKDSMPGETEKIRFTSEGGFVRE